MKQLTIVNRSYEAILCGVGDSSHSLDNDEEMLGQKLNIIPPCSSATLKLTNFAVPLTLLSDAVAEKYLPVDDKCSVCVSAFSVRMPMSLGALWKTIKVPEDCPWRIYRSKV